VLAPLGTAARAIVPSSSATSTSTVGLPRESRISRAPTASMLATVVLLCVPGTGSGYRRDVRRSVTASQPFSPAVIMHSWFPLNPATIMQSRFLHTLRHDHAVEVPATSRRRTTPA
jgi:hypothetical protein